MRMAKFVNPSPPMNDGIMQITLIVAGIGSGTEATRHCRGMNEHVRSFTRAVYYKFPR